MIGKQPDQPRAPVEIEDNDLDQAGGSAGPSPANVGNIVSPRDPATGQKKIMGGAKIGEGN